MALSDYAQLCIGTDGKTTTEVFTSPSGVSLELRKNFAYLCHEGMWNAMKNHSYVSPVVAEIRATNNLVLGDMDIITEAHENGMFIYAHYFDTDKYINYAAIATYGYDDKTEVIIEDFNQQYPDLNLLENYKNNPDDFLLSYCYSDGSETVNIYLPEALYPEHSELVMDKQEKYENEWVGITLEQVQAFQSFLKNNISGLASQWFESIDWSKMTYLNPGDVYLAQAIGMETEPTPVGTTVSPMLHRM